MKTTAVISELELELQESQNQRDRRVEALWQKLDPQRRGELDLRGLQRGFRQIDHPLKNADSILKDIVRAVDTNGDGKIQYEEFRIFVETAERHLMALFRSIDRDRDGRVDKDELREACRNAGLTVSMKRFDGFFDELDVNHDGFISFDEFRDFLLFIPTNGKGTPLEAAYSFYASVVRLTAEGDSVVSDETLEGLGYFVVGAVAGAVSRTCTAPLDRLKVYLLVNTKSSANVALDAAKHGHPVTAIAGAVRPIGEAVRRLYRIGGLQTFFAGNGLNVLKIMPETAIKFGSYEAAKRSLARMEGHDDPNAINPYSKFAAGGLAGMTSQFCVYPLDTLKFRLQSETVEGGLRGHALLVQTAKRMYADGGLRAAYRGLTMGLIGMFPYAAIEMGTFEFLKSGFTKVKARRYGLHEDDAKPGNLATGAMGAFSGAFGATVVYPINVLRTRLQTQGTVMHPPTYTGIVDVAQKTFRNEGFRGLYKGLTPNILKVAPAMSITWICYENGKKILGLQ